MLHGDRNRCLLLLAKAHWCGWACQPWSIEYESVQQQMQRQVEDRLFHCMRRIITTISQPASLHIEGTHTFCLHALYQRRDDAITLANT